MGKSLLHFEKIVYNVRQACDSRPKEWGAASICAVTKTRPAEDAQSAINAGITNIGENRVQEAAEKFPFITGGRRHLIGPLQSNKENKALELFDVIQSIEQLEQCRRLCAKLSLSGQTKAFYIQINTSGESQKHGLRDEAEAFAIGALLRSCPNVLWEGLMTIGPLEGDPRPAFSALRTLRDKMQDKFALPLGLSMGMSGDYITAIQEGATLVRLGTALFGTRNYNL